MSVLVCSDLDRTLIYSAAAFGLSGPDHAMPRLLCVEFYDGRPLSYMTEIAARELAVLAAETTFVPVTTRTVEQYRRVRVLERPPAYAVCANGGHLLVDGVDDPDWTASIRARIDAAPLAEVAARLAGEFVLRARTAADLFAYAVVDRAAIPASWLADLDGWCAERNWRTSLQGRKLYCLPNGLTKSAAAREVAARTGAATILAAGDSLLDRDLLAAADVAVRPAHGELHAVDWDGAEVTAAAGIAAGQEIVAWLRTRATAFADGRRTTPPGTEEVPIAVRGRTRAPNGGQSG